MSKLRPYPGLLTFSEEPFSAGLVQSLLVTLPKAIAAAIAPDAEEAAAAGPADALTGSGTMVTVSDVSLTEAAAATETAVDEAVTESDGTTGAEAATVEATAPTDAAEVTGDPEGEGSAEEPTDLEATPSGDEADNAGTATPDDTDGDTATGNDGDTGEAEDSGSTAGSASGSAESGESAGGSANAGGSGGDE